MPNKNLTQVAIQSQVYDSTPRAHSALFVAANMKNLCIEPELTWDFEQIQRQIRRGTLTPTAPRTGARRMGFRTQMEFTGSVSDNATPPFAVWLRSCGIGKAVVIRATLSAPLTGALYHGARYTEATGPTNEFTVMGHYAPGETQVFVTRIAPWGNNVVPSASTNYNVMSGYTGEVLNFSALTDSAGTAYFPIDAPTVRLEFESVSGLTSALSAGDIIRGITSRAVARVLYAATTGTSKQVFIESVSGDFDGGETVERVLPSPVADIGDLHATDATASVQFDSPAVSIGWAREVVRESLGNARGTFGLRAEAGAIPLFTFEHRGTYNTETSSGIEDGLNVSAIDTTDIEVPPLFTGAGFKVGDTTASFNAYGEEVALCINSFELALNAQVEQIPCANNSSGFGSARIVRRDPTLTIDPELTPEALFAFAAKYRDGATFRTRLTVGQDLGNRMIITAPGCVLRQMGNGDRSEIWTRQLTASLTKGPASLDASEFVLIYEAA